MVQTWKHFKNILCHQNSTWWENQRCCDWIVAMVTFLKYVITKKITQVSTQLKFILLIWRKSDNMHIQILKKMNHMRMNTIIDIESSSINFILKFLRNKRTNENGSYCIKNVKMFLLCLSILFRSIQARTMRDKRTNEKGSYCV